MYDTPIRFFNTEGISGQDAFRAVPLPTAPEEPLSLLVRDEKFNNSIIPMDAIALLCVVTVAVSGFPYEVAPPFRLILVLIL